MSKKAVLFDLDGTLLNTLPDLTAGVNYVRGLVGLSELTEEKISSYIGNGIFMLIKRSISPDASDDEVKNGVEEFRKYYSQNMLAKTKPYDGIPQLLKQLKEDGMLIGVVTNKYHTAAVRLCEHFFSELDIIVGSREGIKVKPDPSMLMYAVKKLNVKQVIFVGDSDVDVLTARNADIPCVAVTWGYRTREQLKECGAKYLADTSDDLYKCITNIFDQYV